jgi:ribosomal protein S18 acetylase RimI-like enzyme
MSNINLVEINDSDNMKLQELAGLAKEIWGEHYASILDREQIDYMLEKFQSIDKMKSDIALNGYRYFVVYSDRIMVGYCAIKAENENKGIFLSKLYIDKSSRGQGISKIFLGEIQEIAKEGGLNHIWLTVNKRNNATISIYKRLGFEIIDEIATDIGDGYVMDDYVMRMNLET